MGDICSTRAICPIGPCATWWRPRRPMRPGGTSTPDFLAGPGDHAIICTFGADLAFYEGALWRHIAGARTGVVLADEVTLARQLSDMAAGGSRLRHINIDYVAS